MGPIQILETTLNYFDWDTEDELDGLIEPDPGIQPDSDTELPVLLMDEETPGLVAVMDTKTLEPNAIIYSTSANIFIPDTIVVCDDSNTLTPNT